MKKLAIFDLDGTLISSLEDLTNCINETFALFSIPFVSSEQCMNALGHGAKNLVHNCLAFSNNDTFSDSEFENILETYSDIYGKDSKNNTVPFDGIVKMLENMRTRGYKTGIVSNKPHQFTLDISKKMFGNLIDFTYGQSDAFPRKPAPDIIHHLIDESGFNPDDSIYIGDSDVDVRTAKNANITSIAVTWGYRSKDVLVKENPDYIVDSVFELEGVLTFLISN